MHCLRVQQVVTDAIERAAVDPVELEEAKRHCRTCAECGRFVTAQLALKRSLVAEPPADLAERVMAAVRAEATPKATAETDEPDARVAAAVLASQLEAASASARLGRSSRAGTRRTWFAAAAGLFVLLGVGALLTATVMSRQLAGERASTMAYESAPQATAPAAGDLAAPDASKQAAPPAATTAVSGPAFITVNDVVYAFKGDSTVSRTMLTVVGSTSSSLDSGSAAPISLTVLAAQGNTGLVYVEYQQRILEFEKVTRDYEGRVYVLRSGTVPGFGVWPSLPADIAQPTGTDGSPSLESADASAVATVFVKKGTDTSSGIAFPPGAAGPNSISGAPVWTWWTPQ